MSAIKVPTSASTANKNTATAATAAMVRGRSVSAAATPLPMAQIYCVVFVQITEAININVLFPFMAFMVEDMGYTGDALGYHVGALAASFCGAQFCSSVPWGMISDRYGRRSAIVIGTLGAAVGMFVFGSAKVYSQAVIGRLLSGLLSGNLGPLKSFLTEITDDTNRGAGFSYMSLAWSIGCIAAPLAGGLLSRPAEKYPQLFSPRGFFAEYPYLLPCLLCVAWNVFASLFCAFYMTETQGKQAHNNSNNVAADVVGVEMQQMVRNPIRKTTATATDGTVAAASGAKGVGAYFAIDQRDTAATDSNSNNSRRLNALVARIDSGGGSGSEDESSFIGDAVMSQSLSRSSSCSSPQQQQQQQQQFGGDELVVDVNQTLSQFSTMHRSDNSSSSNNCGASDNEALEKRETQVESSHSSDVDCYEEGDEEDEEDDEETEGDSTGEGAQQLEEGEEDCFAGCCGTRSDSSLQLASSSSHGLLSANNSSSSTDNCSSDGGDDGDGDGDLEQQSVATTRTTSTDSSSSRNNVSHTLSIKQQQQLKQQQQQQPNETIRVLRQRVVLLSTVNYGMVAAAFILLDESLPLFLKHPVAEGGLSFDSGQIGLLLSISGALMLLFTLFFLPRISRRSKFWMFEFGICWSIPLAFGWPLAGLLYDSLLRQLPATAQLLTLWPLLLAVGLAKNIMACLVFTAVMILINHAVSDRYLGAANGLGQSLAALARSVGPALGGALWSISSAHHFVFLNFISVAALMAVCLLINRQLPRSLDHKKRDKTHQQQQQQQQQQQRSKRRRLQQKPYTQRRKQQQQQLDTVVAVCGEDAA